MSSPGFDPFRQIVWPLAIAETIVWAAMFYSFPALILVWERDLGWTKTELSGALTLSLVVSAVLAPVVGRLIDHGHGRFVFTGCTLLGALLLAVLSQVTELWQFYLVWLGIGIAMSGALYEACFAVLTRAMGTRAKKAITLVTLVAGFAGTVSFPSAFVLVGVVGWRGAVLTFAVAVALVAAPLIWHGSRLAERHRELDVHPTSPQTREVLAILRSATFWFLAVAFAMIALEHGILLTHLLPLLDERGVHGETAILAASMIGPMQVAGRLAMIAAERHVSNLGIAIACYIALGIAALALLGTAVIPTLLVAFVLFQGAGYGVTSIVRPVITAEFLGRRNFGVISGLLALPFITATAAAPTVAAFIWERGGYDRVIVFAILTAAVGLVALLSATALSSGKVGHQSK
jgi:MFS family permease